jgi:uncharacterized protein DUF5677
VVEPSEAQCRLAKYKDELDRLKTAVDLAFGRNVASNVTMPEDRVVFPLGVASRDLFEEIHFLVHHGLGNAALRTARTLYECVVFALYISRHPESWEPYVDTMYAQWANVLRNVPDASQNLPEMHNELVAKVPRYGTGKMAPIEWNDEGNTYKMASEVGISDEFHSLAFGYTSMFVHPSAVFFLRRLSQSSLDGPVTIKATDDDREWRMAMQIAHDLMINSIRLRLKYSQSSELRASLGICETDFLAIWGYKPHPS